MNKEVELTQEEIDVLASHLEYQEIETVALMKVLEKLPDSEYGEGNVPPGAGAYCVICGDQFREDDDREFGERYGKFVHLECAKEEDPEVEIVQRDGGM